MENSKKSCSSCKGGNKLPSFPTGTVLIGFYVLLASIYGTFKFIELIISLF
jgi:hypothetical protein